jgi:DnaJ-domain-containing protein 1
MDQATGLKVCRLIAGIVVVDDDLDPAEEAFVEQILARFGLMPEDRDALFPIMDANEAREEIASLSKPLQNEVFELLVQAAAADKRFAQEERAYLQTVAAVMGIADGEVNQRVAKAMAAIG